VIVIDASAMIEALLRTSKAKAVDERLFGARTRHAPHLIDVEVAQVVRRLADRREIGADRGQAALQNLAVFPLIRHPHDVLLGRIWALRQNLTAYDAAYVALAEALGAALLTCDRRLAKAARRVVRVELI